MNLIPCDGIPTGNGIIQKTVALILGHSVEISRLPRAVAEVIVSLTRRAACRHSASQILRAYKKAMRATYKISHFCGALFGQRDTINLVKRAISVPIVGIRASAGGLESIYEFIGGIPANTGMAYVFVQHLDPRHGSNLVKILSNRAVLPVEEARDGVKISPDRLYVITPNTTLTIFNDVLHSRIRDPAERPHRPVDILFHSLAEKKGPNVFGVILSGSGSDGAKGIQAIKEAGGVTFAEQEYSASFFGMPRSAIQTGCVDFVLAPRYKVLAL